MTYLILGVALFALVHLLPGANPRLKSDLKNRLGDGGYKGLFTLLALSSFGLIILGWRSAQPQYVYLPVAELKPLADKNTEGRRTALGDCHSIIEQGMDELSSRLQQRQVELALRELPELLASVRSTALGEVFSEELAQLDEDSRDLVDRIVAYLEKKYVSLPMKLAKEVVMEQLDKG